MHGVQGVDGMLVGLDCHNKIPYGVWLKQKIPISHNSGGWEAQDQGASRFGFW